MTRTSQHSERQQATEASTHNIQQLVDEAATSLYKDIMAIVEARLELLKIELTQKISLIGAAVVVGVIVIIGATFLLATIALFLGELMGHTFLGFFAVSLIFFVGFWFFTRYRPTLLQHFIQNLLLSTYDAAHESDK